MKAKIVLILSIFILMVFFAVFVSRNNGKSGGTNEKNLGAAVDGTAGHNYEGESVMEKDYERQNLVKKINEAVAKKDLSVLSDYELKLIEFGVDEANVVVDPWLNGFSYRIPITISSGSALTDYQVKTTVDTATLVSNSKMQSDCDDVRFTTSDGYTQIDYYLESGCNTSSTMFWAEVPSIANGSTTIYMYYGNSSAASAASGANTFNLFADFTTAIPSGWTTPGTSSYIGYTFENGNFVLYGGVRGKSTLWWVGNASGYNTNIVLDGRIVESRMKAYQAGTRRTYQYAYNVGIYGGTFRVGRYRFGNYWLELTEGTTVQYSKTSWDGALTGYYIMGLAFDGNYRRVYEDYTLQGSYNKGSAEPDGMPGVIAGQADANADGKYEGYYDWLRVRKFTTTEPTTSNGSEVQLITPAGTGAADWTWKAPAINDKVKTGSAASWTWVTWTNDSAGLTVPYSSAASWTWYP